ncbi:hypothetical protein BKA70DRAFT_460223 [Coprinopsis sp. MPI-PUGE-AT-0042]|nr:hypothetical protein BKA70DRAFT_460223 [Coprinopsis sp. MPI-PUGE-AT-0042]
MKASPPPPPPPMRPDHYQTPSALTPKLSGQQSLASSSNVTISGGTYNTAGRDIHNNFNYYMIQNSSGLAMFAGLVMALKFLDQQMQPQAGGILGNAHQVLSNLSNLVEMSSKIYDALEDSELGNRVRSTIDARITQCTDTLSRAHQQLVYHYFLRCSWDQREPEHIASIREELSIEARCFAEWLSLLQSFCWARYLISRPHSQFAWEMLNTFFSTRPDMMKDIHIERITVLEPLQGKGLTIPLRFVSSLKDVHMVIHLACRGTTSSRYIEGHRYDLEDACTNEVVGEENFQVSVEDGKVFEVAILMKRQSSDLVGCPTCGGEQGGHGAEGGWVRCVLCGTQFIRHRSNSRGTTRVEEVSKGDEYGLFTSMLRNGKWGNSFHVLVLVNLLIAGLHLLIRSSSKGGEYGLFTSMLRNGKWGNNFHVLVLVNLLIAGQHLLICSSSKSSAVNRLDEQGPSDGDGDAYVFRRMKIQIFLKPRDIQESPKSSTSGTVPIGRVRRRRRRKSHAIHVIAGRNVVPVRIRVDGVPVFSSSSVSYSSPFFSFILVFFFFLFLFSFSFSFVFE